MNSRICPPREIPENLNIANINKSTVDKESQIVVQLLSTKQEILD